MREGRTKSKKARIGNRKNEEKANKQANREREGKIVS
jgi:hypothetical protein